MNIRRKSYCIRELLLFAGATLSLMLLGGEMSTAQSSPALSFVTGGEESLTVDLENRESNEEDLIGKVDAVLLNDSNYKGPLTFEFVDRESGESITLGDAQVFPEDELGFFTTGSVSPSVEPFATISIPLRFGGTKKGFAQESVEGVLVAKTADGTPVRPATLPITVVGPEAASRWSQAQIEPTSVTIIATRIWPTPLSRWQPLSAFNREGTVFIRNVGPGTDLGAGDEIAGTRLSSDTAGTSTVSLISRADVPEEEQREIEGILQASDISRAGSYTGSFALDPAVETSPKVTIALKARDLFLWPLVVLLGGAGLAWLLVIRRDQRRPKQLLMIEITKALDKYEKANKANPKCDLLSSRVFPDKGDLENCKGTNADSPKAQKVYCAIKNAKSKDELDERVSEVRDIQELVALWPEICRNNKELTDALGDIPDGVLIRTETNKLLGKKVPPEVKAIKGLLEKYQQQILAVKQWAQGRKLYESALGLYQDLYNRRKAMVGRDQAKLYENNPEILYDNYLKDVANLDELIARGFFARMLDSVTQLKILNEKYPKAGKILDKKEPVTPLRPEMVSAVTENFPIAPQLLTQDLLESTPPAEAVSRMRTHDWWEFLITALLTTLAYMVTLYLGTNFGSNWQYISAFLAGATGPLAINWALLPWSRSYRGVPSTPAK